MTITDFIQQYGLVANEAAFDAGVARFIAEMDAGLSENPGSLKMIPTYISLDDLDDAAKNVIVIDAGGTNLRVALVEFDGKGGSETVYFEKYPMLGTKGEITIDTFFSQLADLLAPVAARGDAIGFCFSFPFEAMPDRDGRILNFNKEVKVAGCAGALLGQGLKKALAAKGLRSDAGVVVINDTVATLLGGKAATTGRSFDSYIGYILGTGTNSCYIEQNAKIVKNSVLRGAPGSSIVNLESGGYACAPRTAVDDAFDATTDAPGTQYLEKMIAGAYQGDLLAAFVKQAAAQGCFSAAFAARAAELGHLDSKAVDDFVLYPYAPGPLAALCEGSEDDRLALRQLMDAFFERAALMTAVNLAAVARKTGAGQNPLRPVCIAAEGTTFFKSVLLHKKLVYYMQRYAEKKLGIYYDFVHAENATITGTAIAGLLA